METTHVRRRRSPVSYRNRTFGLTPLQLKELEAHEAATGEYPSSAVRIAVDRYTTQRALEIAPWKLEELLLEIKHATGMTGIEVIQEALEEYYGRLRAKRIA